MSRMIRNKFKHLQLTDVLQVVVEEISFFIRMPSTCGLGKKLKVGWVRTRVGGKRKKKFLEIYGGSSSWSIWWRRLSRKSLLSNTKRRKRKKNRKINRFSLKRNILPAMKANLGGIQEGNNAAGSLRVHYLIPFKVLLEPARRLHCMSG